MSARTAIGAFLAILYFICAAPQTRSADFQLSNDPLCAFKLKGTIVPGDASRLAELIAGSHRDLNDERTSALCLSSPGGSYDEGLKVSELVYTRGLSTVVEDGSQCFSSCAIIFMSGVLPEREIPYRKLSGGGLLGFHAPYLLAKETNYSKEQIESVSQEMRKALLALIRLASKHTRLGANDFIKKSLITRILENGPEQVFFIKTISEAARWNIEIYDWKKQFPESDALEGVKNLCMNFHYSNMDEPVPANAPLLSVEIDKYGSKFHKDDFRVLVQDSRTKDTVCEVYPRNMKGFADVIFRACSFDYWSSKSFGDCRNYKTGVLVGTYVPSFFTLAPATLLKRFQ